jgi:hypothetical protein
VYLPYCELTNWLRLGVVNADKGELYVWGSNEHRKLGLRKKTAFALPKKMKSKHFAAQVGSKLADAPGPTDPVGPRRVTHIAAGCVSRFSI